MKWITRPAAGLIRAAADYLFATGHLDAARRWVEWGLEQAPDDGELWRLRGALLLQAAGAAASAHAQRDADTCIADAHAAYAKAESLCLDDAEIWREHALVLQNLARTLPEPSDAEERAAILRQAVERYDRVVAAQPRRADVLHERALALAALHEETPAHEAVAGLQRSLEDLDRSLELRPHAPDAVQHRAQIASALASLHQRSGRRAAEIRLRRLCLSDCARALRDRPGWQAPLLLRAVEATRLARLGDTPAERTDEAIAAASEVLADQPRNVAAALIRADARVAAACALRARNDARASLVWRQALADLATAEAAAGIREVEVVATTRASAWVEWGDVLERAGERQAAVDAWGQALAMYDRVVDDDPTDTSRLFGRAGTHLRLSEIGETDHLPKALDDFDQARTQAPNNPAILAGLAEAQRLAATDAEGLAQALASAAQALNAAPDHPAARAARRHSLLAAALQGEHPDPDVLESALQECRWAVGGRPDDPRARYDLACALFLSGRTVEAHTALEHALTAAPGLRRRAAQDPVWQPVVSEDGFRRLLEEPAAE